MVVRDVCLDAARDRTVGDGDGIWAVGCVLLLSMMVMCRIFWVDRLVTITYGYFRRRIVMSETRDEWGPCEGRESGVSRGEESGELERKARAEPQAWLLVGPSGEFQAEEGLFVSVSEGRCYTLEEAGGA